ncbi:hypothetical protein SPI_03947 [Niveomyces insectorum RCEF 264]|uniref:Uncharacterized protein n=1 Tax=Niveomyces insectorum RCEF 264 TaxID=1081102 RepID=A0A167VAP3_9HYPO|nr:hypothetical protein SPI_03947 [Niveomyces insectorum RCEF 264]
MSRLIKRKRSDSELSFSSSTTLSSPPRPGGFDFAAMTDRKNHLVAPTAGAAAVPLHLPGRTRKRLRNNRPSDAEVHGMSYRVLSLCMLLAC